MNLCLVTPLQRKLQLTCQDEGYVSWTCRTLADQVTSDLVPWTCWCSRLPSLHKELSGRVRLILCLQLSFCFFRTAPCLWSQRYCKLGLQGWTDDLLQWTCWTSTDLVTSWFTASLCSENFNFLFKMKDMWGALGSSQYWIITLKLSQGNLDGASFPQPF